jgi:anti-sigma factor ChrR (cupin superfamily)
MAFFQIDAPGFWGRIPERLSAIADRGTEVGMGVSFFVLGDEESDDSPVAVVLRLEPGCVVVRHSHPCERFEVVTSGSLDVGGQVLHPGDVMVARSGEAYGPHTAGPEGCVTVEVFSTLAGTAELTYETLDGPVTVNLAAGGTRPETAIGLQR